jgi:ATP-binding cassette subfamily F protein 3
VRCGERVALLGPNGSGKTTLIRDVMAHGAWDDDTLRVGPSLRVGYAAQEQEVLNDDRTVLDEIRREGLSQERAFALLSAFLFGRDDLSKRVGHLSGGERNRLQLARLMAQQPDFLILDEPTNHLDIPACEAIEDALADFKGTILAVSHDRYFLDKIVARVVEVTDRKLVSYDGNFSEYWHERYQRPVRPAARVATRGRDRDRRGPQPARRSNGAEEALRVRIEEGEREKLALERRIAEAFGRGDHVQGRRAATELERHQSRLDELYERWVAVEEGSAK